MKKLFLILITLLLLPGCGSRWYREFELDENSFDTEAMEMVKDDSGLNLPATAKGLKFAYKPPIDPAFRGGSSQRSQ